MHRTIRTAVVACVCGLVLCQLGCGDTVDDVKNTITCHSVCARYSDCFDSSYDVGGCTDRCESDASDSDQHQQRLNDCHDCMDDKSCTEATFQCTDECLGIVP